MPLDEINEMRLRTVVGLVGTGFCTVGMYAGRYRAGRYRVFVLQLYRTLGRYGLLFCSMRYGGMRYGGMWYGSMWYGGLWYVVCCMCYHAIILIACTLCCCTMIVQ